MYDNIHIGSEVDIVRKSGELLQGKVKWKGAISGRKGEWVGLELFQPDGNHDGFINGRRYFQCKSFHGLFVHPSQVRFTKSKTRKKVVKYRNISKESSADETLFFRGKLENSQKDLAKTAIALHNTAYEQIRDILKGTPTEGISSTRTITHRKTHSVGGCLTPAKQDLPKGGLSTLTKPFSPMYLKKSDPSYNYFLSRFGQGSDRADETFRSPSSIPVIDRTPAHCKSTARFYKHNQISMLSLNKTL